MHVTYTPKGICPREISFEINDMKEVLNINFEDGCEGNLKTIALLLNGKNADEIVNICRFNTCENKPTSCTDQLALAILEALKSFEEIK